jgi:hypothetical protein
VVPPVLGGAAAAVLFGAHLTLRASASLSAVVAVAGVLGGGLAAALIGGRLARRRAWERGRAAAAGAAQEDRRRLLLRLDQEIKNPLTAMRAGLANLDTALRDGSANGAGAAALDSVHAQTLRLGGLLADLRKLAELEARPIERQLVDLDEVLREAAATVRELVGAAVARSRSACRRLPGRCLRSTATPTCSRSPSTTSPRTRPSSAGRATPSSCVRSRRTSMSSSRSPTPASASPTTSPARSGRSSPGAAPPAACPAPAWASRSCA